MASNSRPIVTIDDGKLMGSKGTTESGTPYYVFKGIPFAKPPVGDLRFMPPQPVDPWDGVRDATYERSICCQPKIMKASAFTSFQEIWGLLRSMPTIFRFVTAFWNQSEDCLFLNVHTPKLPSSDADYIDLPVLFWIHGGAFSIGSGGETFSKMEQMLDRGIVVVSINYRLGPFGFISLDTDSAPGNAGMKDQVQGLRWVQSNVSKFGGDPNRVTIYGISAGGAAVHLLTVSPLAKGLFHGAIAASGVATVGWGLKPDHVQTATDIAKLINIEAHTKEELALALKKVSSADLLKAVAKYDAVRVDKTLTCMISLGPCLERPGSPGAFLTEPPDAVMKDGRQAAVPFISGVVANEGILWYMYPFKVDMFSLNQKREMLMPLDMYQALSEDQRKEVGDKIVEFYCGGKGICTETEAEFIHLFGDVAFVVQLISTCRLYAATSSAPVYMYRFSFDGKLNGSRRVLRGHPGKGPGHGDEIGYILVPMMVIPRPRLRPQDPEIKMTQQFSGTIANFIKTGKPTIPDRVNPAGTVWNPVTEQTLDYLDMDLEFQVKDDKFGPRLQFWNDLYKKYLNAPFMG